MKRLNKLMTAGFLVLALVGIRAQAQAVVYLPDPALYAVQYDDFYSYSAKLLNAFAFPGFEKEVATGTGGLDIILFTGAGGASNQDIGAGKAFDFEDPMDAPGGSAATFSDVWGRGGVQLNGPVLVDNLYNYLQVTFGPQAAIPVFNFDMNQTGKDANLDVVAKVSILNEAGSEVASWAFDNQTNGTFDPAAWVLSPATITVPNPNNPVETITVDNNKGSGKADFIVYAPTMDLTNFINQGYYFVTDFRMERLNNGFEELFLTGAFAPTPPPPPIPEPSTLLLLGGGLVGLGLLGSRRRK